VRRFSGRFRSALIIGIQGIRARKLRTLLSMVSLFLGVLAVVVVEAGAQTAQRAALADVELYWGIDGTLQVYVSDARASGVIVESLLGRGDAVGVSSVNAIIGEPNVRPVNEGGAPFDVPGGWGMDGMTVTCNPMGECEVVEIPGYFDRPVGAAIELQLVAMTGDVRQFRPYRPVSGQWLDFTGDPSFSPALVLNKEAAKGFERYRVPAEMRITGASDNPTPRIIGVVDDGQMQPMAYVRMDELLNWLSLDSTPSNPYGPLGVEVLAAPTATDTLRILRANLAAIGVGEEAIHVQTINSREQAESQLAILRVIFFGMAGLVLLIGVAGILNVTLATVGERIEEFALRRAVGTPRLLLGGIVLAETMLTGLLTAAAAVGFAAVALQILGPMLASEFPSLGDMIFPWQAAVAGVIAGLTAGVLGGLIPAVRAARIPIASVMRA
jgi:putative ABC transport system permease protein